MAGTGGHDGVDALARQELPMSAPRPPVTPELVRTLAEQARLSLDEDRVAQVVPVLDLVTGLVDQLDGIGLGDVPPATSFEGRWS